MKINDAGLELIKSFEGVRLAPYKDPVGIPTIGVGATFYQDGRKVTMNDPIMTDAQVTELLKFHLNKFEQDVSNLVKVPLNSNQFSALVSFAFNAGTGNLKTSTLLKKLNQLDYKGAADELLKWTKSKGQELPGLVRRRKAERELFLKLESSNVVQSAKDNQLPDGPSEQDISDILKNLEKGLV